MKSARIILLFLSVFVSAIAGSPQREEASRSIASPGHSKQYLTTIRRLWSCKNGICEETVTKCTNNVCDSTKNHFKAEGYQPEVPQVVSPPIDFQNIAETFKFPPVPSINIETPFDNSGLIDLVSNNENFSYYWSNSKHVSRRCENKNCIVTTKTCSNGKCEEKTEHESL